MESERLREVGKVKERDDKRREGNWLIDYNAACTGVEPISRKDFGHVISQFFLDFDPSGTCSIDSKILSAEVACKSKIIFVEDTSSYSTTIRNYSVFLQQVVIVLVEGAPMEQR